MAHVVDATYGRNRDLGDVTDPELIAYYRGEGYTVDGTFVPLSDVMGGLTVPPGAVDGDVLVVSGGQIVALPPSGGGGSTGGGTGGPDPTAVHYGPDTATSGMQAQARTNLGLSTAAVASVSAFDPAGAAATVQSASLQKASNLSDLTNAGNARTALGLGTAATQATTAFDAAGAATAARNAAIGVAFILGG